MDFKTNVEQYTAQPEDDPEKDVENNYEGKAIQPGEEQDVSTETRTGANDS